MIEDQVRDPLVIVLLVAVVLMLATGTGSRPCCGRRLFDDGDAPYT